MKESDAYFWFFTNSALVGLAFVGLITEIISVEHGIFTLLLGINYTLLGMRIDAWRRE